MTGPRPTDGFDWRLFPARRSAPPTEPQWGNLTGFGPQETSQLLSPGDKDLMWALQQLEGATSAAFTNLVRGRLGKPSRKNLAKLLVTVAEQLIAETTVIDMEQKRVFRELRAGADS